MKRESTLLGLCERRWRPEYNDWSLTCDNGMFLLFSATLLCLAIGLFVMCVGWAIAEIHKAKRSGIDVDAIIHDVRRNTSEGRDDYRG